MMKFLFECKYSDSSEDLCVLARQLDGDGLGLEIVVEAVGAILPSEAGHLVATKGLLRTHGLKLT